MISARSAAVQTPWLLVRRKAVHSNSQESAFGGVWPWNRRLRPEFSAAASFSNEDIMGQINRLPSEFPDGARYVIEARAGHILSRYLEFPDGRQVELPAVRVRPQERVRAPRRLRNPRRPARACADPHK